jgi:hypothetical protein
MKHLALVALAVLAACGTDGHPPFDASIDAPTDASVDAAMDASSDASTLPFASPNDGAHCLAPNDCSGGVPCDQGICSRSCFLGLCTISGEHCYQDRCVWECSTAYQCPATTSCVTQPGYALCL